MNKIKVIETFAGVGSQKMALKKQNIPHEVVGISEWEINAIISYDAIHTDDGVDYTAGMSKREILEKLKDFTFSSDGKKPCNISKIREKRLRQLYNANKRSKNLGSIMDNHNFPECDLLTYSFPCQDISIAGEQKGFEKGGGTRSGLLWEIEEVLNEYKKTNKLPKVLMLENVKNLVGKKFIDGFNEWKLALDKLGYNTYHDVLDAKNFDVPQSRNRVFAVSFLKNEDNGKFCFKKGDLTNLTIKDVLENSVDRKYYITNENAHKLINKVKQDKLGKFPSFDGHPLCSSALASWEHRGQGWRKISGTLCARDYKDPKVVCVPVDATLNNPKELVISNCITARYDSGIQNQQSIGGVILDGNDDIGFMIRKYTPLECWRLMGFSDDDFYKAQKVNSNTQLYKQAGNSIVVPVLESIFMQIIKNIK